MNSHLLSSLGRLQAPGASPAPTTPSGASAADSAGFLVVPRDSVGLSEGVWGGDRMCRCFALMTWDAETHAGTKLDLVNHQQNHALTRK